MDFIILFNLELIYRYTIRIYIFLISKLTIIINQDEEVYSKKKKKMKTSKQTNKLKYIYIDYLLNK